MTNEKHPWLERPIHPALPFLTNEVLLFGLVILLAIATRFYMLEPRVMSHDESLHTYFSWLLYRGQGYQHSPMMHGPFQFHIIALTYFLFGVSDFTARIPAALFGVATVWMVWYWRNYLGKAGAIIAGLLMVISPYMLYYSRYVRNESFVAFSGVVMLYATLRYLETAKHKYLYFFAAALMLHYTSKETSYIYAAQILLYLAIYFIARITRRPWKHNPSDYRAFIVSLVIGMALAGLTVFAQVYTHRNDTLSGTETAAPAAPGQIAPSPALSVNTSPISMPTILAVLAILAIGAAAYYLIHGYGWKRILRERSFDLLILSGTIVLPLLTAFLIDMAKGWLKVSVPTEAANVQSMTSRDIIIIGTFLLLTFGLSALIGLFWNRRLWWKLALTFWVPFTVLYTTFFTNSDGFFTGTIGSLGYWIVQQDVQRGSQPWYYYLLVQIPIYEFLPAIGLLLAILLGLRRILSTPRPPSADTDGSGYILPETPTALENALVGARTEVAYVRCAHCKTTNPATAPDCYACGAPLDEAEAVLVQVPVSLDDEEAEPAPADNFTNTFSLLVWWSISSVAAFSYAGERMPWLTVHMAWPMILITGWALGYLFETLDWESLREKRVWVTLGTVTVLIAGFFNAVLAWGLNPPFQGKDLIQLQATSAFVLPAAVTLASVVGAVFLLRTWTISQITRVFTLTFFVLLTALTIRASFRASYIEYDNATEFLVYAHGATGIKQVMAQAADISERTASGTNLILAYDASAPDTGVSWPFVWYLRDYTNQRSFDAPTRSLREAAVVVVDQKNFDKIEPALGPNYYRVDYIRMWWPMQDYFNLVTPRDATIPFDDTYSCRGALGFLRLLKGSDYSRVCSALLDPQIRAGLVDIWLNRDYTRYAQATGRSDLTLSTWQPADQMRLYVQKDVAAKIWNYGVGPAQTVAEEDPTEGKVFVYEADAVLDASQANPVTLNYPRSMAFARDGSFYVADSLNHRILHLNPDGTLLQEWGSLGQSTDETPAPLGTFNEPWGVAVGPDGSVYVTDTWNHRVQKFTATGKPLSAWGIFGQGETLLSLYGPRGIAVDSKGRVYVADTGNKRLVVFDSDGTPITQIGSGGYDPGMFDEPVGVAVDADGRIYVADTWNQRIQTFLPSLDDSSYYPEKQWDVYGWFSQSLDNKPFIAVNAQGHVFVTDPEGFRVMEYTGDGELLRVWGDYGNALSNFGLPSGIAIDAEGHVWVTDAVFQRILRFTVP
jgi:predicted membrane-bound mannosyltransferase/sugar lactone lactonase YvrE